MSLIKLTGIRSELPNKCRFFFFSEDKIFPFHAMINILKILVLFIDNRMEKLIKYKISKTYKNSRDWEWISK